jgi:hypothetical protein
MRTWLLMSMTSTGTCPSSRSCWLPHPRQPVPALAALLLSSLLFTPPPLLLLLPPSPGLQ